MGIDRKCIPPYLFNLVVRVLEQDGYSSAGLVAGLDFTLEDLTHQDMRISFSDALRMIDNAYGISGDAALGLTIANEVNIADWGMMGYAVASCASLGESLAIGQRYSRAATRLTDNSLHDDGEVCCHRSVPLYAAGEAERFLVEEDLGGVVGMLHRYLGDEANPLEVHFTYSEPPYSDAYARHFRCPLKFGQGWNQIVWRADDMQRPLPQRNPAATAMAIEHCKKLIAEDHERGSMIEKVRSCLVQNPGHYPSINEVAAAFHMSESSLRRSLKAVDSSYQQILNDVRKKVAIEYLETSSLKLEEIAQLVGYSDLSNFRRAFRHWTGVPPLHYRKQPHG